MQFSFKQTKCAALVVAALALSVGGAGQARATLVTFDIVKNNDAVGEPNVWNFSGLNFSTTGSQQVRGDLVENGARDGTPVFIYEGGQTISTIGGSPFSLQHFDIGLSFSTLPTDTATLTLNFEGGGSSTATLGLTQNFQTVTVNESNLASVQISQPLAGGGFIALDNILYNEAVSASPEPASLTLLGLSAFGLMGYAGLRRRIRSEPTA